MNLLAGMIIIAVLFAGASGFYVDQISGFSEGFPLEGESGLMVGDVFYKVDGWRTYLRGDAAMLLSFNDGQGVDIEVIRNGKKIVLEDLPLYRGTYDGQSGRFGLLIGEMQIPTSFLTKLRFIGYQTLDFIQQEPGRGPAFLGQAVAAAVGVVFYSHRYLRKQFSARIFSVGEGE